MNNFENKIEDMIKIFNHENVEVKFDNFLKGKISFNNMYIKYDETRGFLRLGGEENHLEFNILDVNYFDYKENKVEINLDNSLKINIIKK